MDDGNAETLQARVGAVIVALCALAALVYTRCKGHDRMYLDVLLVLTLTYAVYYSSVVHRSSSRSSGAPSSEVAAFCILTAVMWVLAGWILWLMARGD